VNFLRNVAIPKSPWAALLWGRGMSKGRRGYSPFLRGLGSEGAKFFAYEGKKLLSLL
jgi:hypothetical protein